MWLLHPQFSKSAGPVDPAIESGGAPSAHAQQPQTSSPLLNFMHASWCSLILCSSLLVVSAMYTFPQLYTTQELMLGGNLSLTLESCALKVIPDLNAVLMLNLLHTRLMSSLRPDTWRPLGVTIRCVCKRFNIKTAFRSGMTLRAQLSRVKPPSL